ncbi:transglutaminase domain-containing protein [Melioribacter sp. OK-6-Me]|uniref:transglutaminase domain-containing protein n=1 Tax=unclassified Melioribacter TaxID=2627329 RepID=UPI003EDB5500
MNGLEGNISNFSNTEDFELMASFSFQNENRFNSNLYSLSISKAFGNHNFYFRYSPGIVQNFIIKSSTTIQLPDTIASLKTELNYSEKFGISYSYKLSSDINLGFSLRYFEQTFREESPILFYTDSVNYISIKEEELSDNFWRGDLGFDYVLNERLSISLSTINLFISKEDNSSEASRLYSLRTEKGISASLQLKSYDKFMAKFGYEYGFEKYRAFYAGLNYSFNLAGGIVTAGTLFSHDKFRHPFISSVIPSIAFTKDGYTISTGAIKYVSASTNNTTESLVNEGIYSLFNNPYSVDRAFVNFNLALSFKSKQLVKFIDVSIDSDIYPTLSEIYFNKPFATGRVVNISNEIVEVRPASFIKSINNEPIFSPLVKILPGDTVDIGFFTTVSNTDVDKRKIEQADFYLYTDKSEPDDYIQKPVLLHDKNSWDGNVFNLIYFVRKGFEFTNKYSREILNKYPRESTADVFRKIKILYDEFSHSLEYVSDPRSSTESVQFPHETIELKGGDCDDLSVCFSSMLESIGIQTAFVDYKNPSGVSHVNLLVNTELTPSELFKITNNDNKVVVRKNEEGVDQIWLPIETTVLSGFEDAWTAGADKFNKEAIEKLGLSKGTVVIIDIY